MNARLITAALAGCVALHGTVWAADPAVTVTTTPATLTLCPGAEGRVLVTVRNATAEPIRALCLTAFTNGPLKVPVFSGRAMTAAQVCPGGVAVDQVSPGGAVSQLVTLALTGYPTTSAHAYLWASYQSGTNNVSSETAAGIVEVQAPAPPGSDALKLEARTGFSSLHEAEIGRVTLTMTNGTSEQLVQLHATASPAFDTAVKNAPAAPPDIAPQSSVALDFEIHANSEIHPGKYIGLIDVDATTSCGVAIHRVASYEVTLGVFGQSELLTTIGVPSLLLLPGFLIVTMWMLLWRLKLRVSFLARSGSDDFAVTAKEPEFWLLGITFSLAMFALAPRVTQIGYRRPYALADIAALWGISLGIGLVVYLLLLTVDRIVRRIARAIVRARTLTEIDDVLKALQKIKRHGWPRRDIRAVETRATPTVRGFRLWSDDGQRYWVIPQIQYKLPGGASRNIDAGAQNIEIPELLKRLQEIKANQGAVEWAPQDNAPGKPRQLTLAEIQDTTGELVVMQ